MLASERAAWLQNIYCIQCLLCVLYIVYYNVYCVYCILYNNNKGTLAAGFWASRLIYYNVYCVYCISYNNNKLAPEQAAWLPELPICTIIPPKSTWVSINIHTTRSLGALQAPTYIPVGALRASWLRPLRPSAAQAVWWSYTNDHHHPDDCIVQRWSWSSSWQHRTLTIYDAGLFRDGRTDRHADSRSFG